jgi:hypothetical protein
VVHSAAAGEAQGSWITQEGTEERSSGTQVREAGPVCTGAAAASTVRGRSSRGGWVGRQLWTLLNAQALLNGTAGGRGDVAVFEDDYRRLAARRAR